MSILKKQMIGELAIDLSNEMILDNELKDEMLKIQQEADKKFLNSAEYRNMSSRIEFLESQSRALEITNDALNQKNLQLLRELAKYKN